MSEPLPNPLKVEIPLSEYLELIKLRNEHEKLRRENYGLRTTVANLRQKADRRYGIPKRDNRL